MRLSHVVPSIEAQYGGPSKSVHRLCQALAAEENPVELLATDPTTPARRTEGALEIRIFRRGSPGFLCPSGGLRDHLRGATPAAIHHHGLWLRTLHYARTAAAAKQVPLVISPRGMMGAWAWHHHRLRKRLCSLFVHPGALAGAAGWHATSEDEAGEIRGLGFEAPICVAPNGVAAPAEATIDAGRAFWLKLLPAAQSRPIALFYSRFHSKKRVRELIELWGQRDRADWLLLLVGIPEEFSVDELNTFVASRGLQGKVLVFDGTDRPAPYPIASLFLLPSHNENFGMSIAEAMTHGVPVVVTDATPWKEVNARRCGWCVPFAEFASALGEALRAGPAALQDSGRRAREWVLAEYSWTKSAQKLLRFYQSLPTHVRT